MTREAIIQIAIVAAVTSSVSPVVAYFMTRVLIDRLQKVRPKTKGRDTMRKGKLLVEVKGLSGTVYPIGTEVQLGEHHMGSFDAFIDGDWIPLAWWECGEGVEEP